MQKYITEIKKCPLFAGIAEQDLGSLLKCLMAQKRGYQKGEYIFLAGDKAEQVGIVLSGQVHVVQEDFWGSRTIFTNVSSGGLFAEAFACAETMRLPLSVVASEDAQILLVNYRKIINTCPTACSFHSAVIANMLRIMANKNITLTHKIEHISKRTLREKLQAYLSWQAQLQGSREFDISFSRQELAEYLSVDRSALSRELSAMQTAGLIAFKKNHFVLAEARE